MKPNLLMTIILPLFILIIGSGEWDRKLPASVEITNQQNPFPSIGSIPAPQNWTRVPVEKKSFGEWLRDISLKKNKTVYLFDGTIKKDQSAQFAVLNIPIGNKDLQQCADAVMRLRAEYLYTQERFDEIIFRDNNNTKYAFGSTPGRNQFDKYLEKVFSYCGTLSLEKELRVVKNNAEVKIGDVLIQGGSPGHAMLVVDMASNKEGKKIFLLAQGYMPAQDIHIVVNPSNPGLSPWYDLDEKTIKTPGWTFFPGHFKSF